MEHIGVTVGDSDKRRKLNVMIRIEEFIGLVSLSLL